MPLPLYYFLTITAVNILMSWALYVPYRMAHLHFIVVANMAISGYTAAYMVLSLQLPFAWAFLAQAQRLDASAAIDLVLDAHGRGRALAGAHHLVGELVGDLGARDDLGHLAGDARVTHKR